MPNGKLESLITIPTGNWTMDFVHSSEGSKTITLTAANTYYWSSAGNDTVDLVARLEALLDAAFTADWTVSIGAGENGTGKVTISVAGGGTFTTANTDADLQTLLGMTGGEFSSGAASQTSPGHVRGLWLPDGPPQSLYGVSSVGWSEFDAATTEAPDGTTVSTAYNEKRANGLGWICKRSKVVVEYESTAGESYEQFYRDCVYGNAAFATAGGPIRWTPDAADDATFHTYKLPVRSVFRHERLSGDWVGYFQIAEPRLVKVP